MSFARQSQSVAREGIEVGMTMKALTLLSFCIPMACKKKKKNTLPCEDITTTQANDDNLHVPITAKQLSHNTKRPIPWFASITSIKSIVLFPSSAPLPLKILARRCSVASAHAPTLCPASTTNS